MESASPCSFPGDAEADAIAVEEAITTLTKADMEELMLHVRRFYAMLHGIHPRKRVRATFVKYDPARQSTAFNSGPAEMPFDPLAQHKRRFSRPLPRPSRSRPVRSSPPRPLPRRDQDDWKAPPCVDNRKNPGKRQPASSAGVGTLDDQIVRNFGRLAEALDAAEKEAFLIRNKPDEGSSGGAPVRAAAGKRERPVEFDFDEPEQSDDPFDLDQFMSKFACLGMDDFDLDELLGSMLHIR
ncbi:SNW domain-containing protein 1 [Triticum urartu]|uniref:SNW domain-containing protein 1 n=1 Tax=Triticum urartu TaxID=4572 RepID=M7ZV60_TRIUA|nr:SNW/SKI-interacting protein B-like [Triticum dicoccoides]XP_037456488.1 SNW/SKI-interacting protein B-like [Triticum dicoccoides]XP_048545443.1 SNW/SKI-interacting protein B-like [Triticum urartu]EMS56280.1 SNW domain-containing protein 1 [Triticum urartu]